MEMSKPLVRRHKKKARIALYLAPLLIWLGMTEVSDWLGLIRVYAPWRGVDYTEIESVRLLQEFLRIDSRDPEGNEIPAVEFLAEQLAKEGIESHIERLGERNANLWALLEGEDPRPLVLHQHVDVDPILFPERWKAPPFGGEYQEPYIVGRGAFDMKSVGIAQLMAMLEIQRAGTPLRRSLMLLATGDEETGSDLGTRRVLREHPEWSEQFWAVLTEGGAVEALDAQTVKYWGTEIQQRRYPEILVCSSSREPLEDLWASLSGAQSARRLTDTARIVFPEYGPSRDQEVTRDLLSRPDDLLQRLRSFPTDLTLQEFPPVLEAMLRDQVSPWPVRELADGTFELRIIFLLLPDTSMEQAMEILVGDLLEGSTYRVEESNGIAPLSSPDHEAFRTIDRVVRETHPKVDHGPLFVVQSATDARFFREHGIPSFGFSPFLVVSSEAHSLKGANERISAPAFVDGVALYGEVVRRLVGE